jgi:hypothetical protein
VSTVLLAVASSLGDLAVNLGFPMRVIVNERSFGGPVGPG